MPPEQWHFAVRKDGGNVPDRCHLTVDAGFKAGDLYELTYCGENAAIVGPGPQAVRDFATAVRDGAVLPARASDAKVLLAYGYSQSARFLRDFLCRGFNRRTDGKRVFNGTLIFAAGSGRGSFDHSATDLAARFRTRLCEKGGYFAAPPDPGLSLSAAGAVGRWRWQ